MIDKKDVDYTSDKVLQAIYTCAMEVFGQGIAIPSDKHPCSWDWLDFTYIDDILVDRFDVSDFSDSMYDGHEFQDLTLKEILIKVEGKYLFEINHYVNWEE